MSSTKPRHLQADYAAQFTDTSVVAAYSTRPPYPESVFEQLAALAVPARGYALDLGAGTGDVAFGLAERTAGVDAVEPSAAMISAARQRAPSFASAHAVRWLEQTAESFVPERAYALVVAGESLHWMAWEEVLPMIATALAPGAQLGIIADRMLEDLPWQAELGALCAEYSTNRDYRPYDIGHELSARGLFRERARRHCYTDRFTQPLAAYVTSFHSRNGFSRDRMDPGRAAAFDAALERMVLRYSANETVSCRVRSTVIWGLPVSE